MSRRRVIAVLLAGPLLAGCAAGRDAQTINTSAVSDAASTDLGSLQLRNVRIAPPETGVYGEGGDAPLYFTVANNSATPDTLTSVTSQGARSVVARIAEPAGGAAAPAGESGLPLEIPGGEALQLGPAATHLVLQGLTRRLLPSQSVQVTFTFAGAGSTTLIVPVELEEDGAGAP